MNIDYGGMKMTQQLIFCPTCNHQIFIIPDLKEMSIAIESHIKTHNLTFSSATIQTNHDKIRTSLHEQLLQRILITTNDEKRTIILEGNLGRYPHEGFYIKTLEINYINDILKVFENENIRITIEEL